MRWDASCSLWNMLLTWYLTSVFHFSFPNKHWDLISQCSAHRIPSCHIQFSSSHHCLMKKWAAHFFIRQCTDNRQFPCPVYFFVIKHIATHVVPLVFISVIVHSSDFTFSYDCCCAFHMLASMWWIFSDMLVNKMYCIRHKHPYICILPSAPVKKNSARCFCRFSGFGHFSATKIGCRQGNILSGQKIARSPKSDRMRFFGDLSTFWHDSSRYVSWRGREELFQLFLHILIRRFMEVSLRSGPSQGPSKECGE